MLETEKSAGKTLETLDEKVRNLIDNERYSISAASRKLKVSRRTIKRIIERCNIEYDNAWTKSFVEYMTPMQDEMLRGSILGDACLYKFKTCLYPTLMFYHSISQKEYIELKFEIWKNLVSNKTIKKRKREKGSRLYFNTCSNKCFSLIYNQVYINGKKEVTKQFLDTLTPTSLAFWFMDDGSRCKNKGLALHTNSFSLSEVEIICEWFKNKYNILCHPQKRKTSQWVVFFSAKTTKDFAEIILPFVYHPMRYKLKGVFLKNPQRLYAIPFLLFNAKYGR